MLTTLVDDVIEIWLPDGRQILVTDVEHRGEKSRVGFTADRDIRIFRRKVADRIRAAGSPAAPDAARMVPTVLEAGMAAAVAIPVPVVPAVADTRAAFQAAVKRADGYAAGTGAK